MRVQPPPQHRHLVRRQRPALQPAPDRGQHAACSSTMPRALSLCVSRKERIPLRRRQIAPAVQPPANGNRPNRPFFRPNNPNPTRRHPRRQPVQPGPPREKPPERQARSATAAGIRCRSNSRSRQCRINFGSGIRTGQTLSHLPQNVDAFGKCPALSTPIRLGVSTAPIGPG